MPAHTAAQKLRAKFGPFPATIEGVEVTLRRPDIRHMIYTRTLPVPLLDKVGTLLSTWVGQNLTQLTDEARETGGDALEAINYLCVTAFVNPKVVMTPEAVLDDDTICVHDLELDFKEKCLIRAMAGGEGSAEVEAASRFPGVERSEGTAPDVQGVRPEAVGSSADR